MFGLTGSHRYSLYSDPTDMRKSFDGLAGLVRNELGRDPQNGEVFVSINKRRDRIKLLHWAGSGFTLYYKRLEGGTFELPGYDLKASPSAFPIPGWSCSLIASPSKILYCENAGNQQRNVDNKTSQKPVSIRVIPTFGRGKRSCTGRRGKRGHPPERIRKAIGRQCLLKQQLAELKRMIFGTKSERFIPSDTGQAQLFDTGNIAEEETVPAPAAPYPATTSPKKKKPVRALSPAHLPRREETIEPEDLARGAKKIGEEITELLEYNPAKLFVRRIVRPKYAQPGKDGVSIAELPTLPLPKSNAGPGLLAHILVSKFVDHLPFYRQVKYNGSFFLPVVFHLKLSDLFEKLFLFLLRFL